jgi:hypothetical protein
MPKKPNYGLDRRERDRLKAAKAAAKAAAKLERRQREAEGGAELLADAPPAEEG